MPTDLRHHTRNKPKIKKIHKNRQLKYMIGLKRDPFTPEERPSHLLTLNVLLNTGLTGYEEIKVSRSIPNFLICFHTVTLDTFRYLAASVWFP